MKTHIEAIGIINVVLGALTLLVGIVAAVALLLATQFTDPEGKVILPLVMLGVGFLVVALGGPSLVAGVGLLKYKAWARILALVLAVLSLFNIPIGTAIGVYTIWALTKDETVALLH